MYDDYVDLRIVEPLLLRLQMVLFLIFQSIFVHEKELFLSMRFLDFLSKIDVPNFCDRGNDVCNNAIWHDECLFIIVDL